MATDVTCASFQPVVGLAVWLHLLNYMNQISEKSVLAIMVARRVRLQKLLSINLL